jgi:hypothetical protein
VLTPENWTTWGIDMLDFQPRGLGIGVGGIVLSFAETSQPESCRKVTLLCSRRASKSLIVVVNDDNFVFSGWRERPVQRFQKHGQEVSLPEVHDEN